MKRAQLWVLAVPIIALLFLVGCSGSTSSLIGDSSSSLSARQLSVPMQPSDDLRGLPAPSLSDWRSFSSSHLRVAINHPMDWSVKEQSNSIDFTSPDGIVTQLKLIGKGDLSPNGLIYGNDLPDARCSTATNAHGVTVRACFDELAESRTASFIIQYLEGPARIFSLLTGTRGSVRVFDAMIASIRPPAY